MTSDLNLTLQQSESFFLLTFQFNRRESEAYSRGYSSLLSFLALCLSSDSGLASLLSPWTIHLFLDFSQNFSVNLSLVACTRSTSSVFCSMLQYFAVHFVRLCNRQWLRRPSELCAHVSVNLQVDLFQSSRNWQTRRGAVQSETTFPSFPLISSLLSHNIKFKYLYY